MKKAKLKVKPLTVKSMETIRPVSIPSNSVSGNNGGYTWVG